MGEGREHRRNICVRGGTMAGGNQGGGSKEELKTGMSGAYSISDNAASAEQNNLAGKQVTHASASKRLMLILEQANRKENRTYNRWICVGVAHLSSAHAALAVSRNGNRSEGISKTFGRLRTEASGF